jgi:hypothetical protein
MQERLNALDYLEADAALVERLCTDCHCAAAAGGRA